MRKEEWIQQILDSNVDAEHPAGTLLPGIMERIRRHPQHHLNERISYNQLRNAVVLTLLLVTINLAALAVAQSAGKVPPREQTSYLQSFNLNIY